ncbi:alpha/beta hydrolase [Sphingopyxis sp. BSN-002]|uniref:alpha/beta hydrolase n=1 Tax=Sphingopyxis sp. BSN-002 TaxID=2911495 RepID=UPI001EDB0B94|nr:alpha/beta hydrolase [Sphingopyxis sp. BSN-002]UKK85945.1 alpha/beta hydrolase [Sphingopyxis sp. BSN-002]
MIKFLIVAVILLLLFGGGAKMVVSGGARSLDMADKLLGSDGGARLLIGDQPYGNGPRQTLDIWVPENAQASDKLPVIVFFYGGGWDSGARENYGFAGRALAQKGFVVVIPDYRLVPKAHWPDFLEDSAKAVAWTHLHIGGLAGDPDRIALMGHSAGAYNAVMLALDPTWLRGARSDPSIIRGVAGLAGPYDFLPMEKGGSADKAMGKVKPAERTQPIAYARGDAPPLWLATGDEDTTARPRNSQNLAAAIEKAGGSAALRIYPDMGHTGIVMALAGPFRSKGPVLDEATDFLRGVTGRRIARAEEAAQ